MFEVDILQAFIQSNVGPNTAGPASAGPVDPGFAAAGLAPGLATSGPTAHDHFASGPAAPGQIGFLQIYSFSS